jgi:hypothetical protein
MGQSQLTGGATRNDATNSYAGDVLLNISVVCLLLTRLCANKSEHYRHVIVYVTDYDMGIIRKLII